MFDPSAKLGQDPDPQETREWLDSLDAVLHYHGDLRARFLLEQLLGRARRYRNTLPAGSADDYPGDLALEQRIENIIRWNAALLVSKANQQTAGLGGHISTYASTATLFEVAFNHFLQGKEAGSGDQIYFQPHASPGVYARAYVEGRLTLERMRHFRRETSGKPGLSSYPHPWLMPHFWEFPTASMGLAPLSAIYQARFNRYLHNRDICDTSQSRVWAFLGDGEMDEPESMGAISIAAREQLNNLVFVVNCNLQRLDGPVRGNGKIIEELARRFDGAGWQVIKCVWGSGWDALLEADTGGTLQQRLDDSCDGDWQRISADGPGALREMVGELDDETLARLVPGGHDRLKVFEAYTAACASDNQPTVVLAQTIKGFGLGDRIAGKNTTHMAKVLDNAQLKELRDLLEIPLTDRALNDPPFYRPKKKSPEMQYLMARRAALGGSIPRRQVRKRPEIKLAARSVFIRFLGGSGERQASSTAAFAQLLGGLMKDPQIGARIVPIVPDEARTFGIEALFATHGIYSPSGQRYEPPDRDTLLAYREATDGQVLQEGICEAGAMASFTAAGTSYATHGEPMIPFYIFYSIFGFQRTGDQIWAFGDQRGRGFLMGATAGRTTLSGEGLQHEDGQSHLLATMMPNIRAYDPAFAYEVALIIQDGMRRMIRQGENTFYYITLYNENYLMPALPEGVRDGILDGMYLLRPADNHGGRRAKILASGPIVLQALRAQELLAKYWGVSADVYSATSWQLLRREALETERHNRLHPMQQERLPMVTELLSGPGPVVAASDYLMAVPDQIARWVPGGLTSLGTDGFGRSDSRPALRRHFEVDAESIVIAVLSRLSRQGKLDPRRVVRALRRFGIDPDRPDPRRA